ncbi:MAG: DUF4097 family beta strand repeat protein [Clostridia bacterium]|nr:DUF4097 family beta strand repeat protein [Clostridia bacterium]
MKKTFKIISIYLGVLLLAAVATVVFCAAFLFFYRDGNIFGIKYINAKEIIYATETENMDDLQVIEVQSSDFDVKFSVNKNVDTLVGAMRNKVFGYAKKSKAQAKFGLEYNEETKVAVFTSVEPKGWLNKKDCYIEIAIPENWANKGDDLVIKTSKGDITVGNDNECNIGNLAVESLKGDVNISNLTLSKGLNIDIGSGTLFVDGECETAGALNSTIKVGSGMVNISKINVEKFNLGVVEVKSIKRGKIGILKADELITDGNINGGGKIEVGEVGFVDFSSLDTNLYINSIIGGNQNATSSRITITGNGDMYINNADCNLEVNGNNGEIEIGTVTGTLASSTNKGNIIVSQALKLISAVTESGSINISFSSAALDYVDTDINDANKNRAVVATTKNGHIIVKGLQNGYITATGNGRISLEYDKVVGQNEMISQAGGINIIVPNPSDTSAVNEFAFNLKVTTEVSADVKVGVAGSIGSVDFTQSGTHEFNNIYNSASSTSNNLNVISSTGAIKIRSADLVGF